jgi:uncharacterized protein (TIGR03000 family)
MLLFLFILHCLGVRWVIPLIVTVCVLVLLCMVTIVCLGPRHSLALTPASAPAWHVPTAHPLASPPAVNKAHATAAKEARATVIVHVPADAELWLEGSKGKQVGETRRFHTPPLETGLRYSYEVRAHWLTEGKAVDQTREVAVCGGETTEVDFTKSGATIKP